MDPALKVTINAFNAFINEINKANYKIYDEENQDFYIDRIEYNNEDNKIYFIPKRER